MKKIWIAASICFCFGPAVFAATTTMTLTGVSGPTLGGVYTSPYIATVGGVDNVFVICDDFESETYVGETWTASVSDSASLNGVKWNGGFSVQGTGGNLSLGSKTLLQAQAYSTAAYLVMEILQAQQAGNTDRQSDLSFSLWALFDGANPLTYISGSHLTNALQYLSDAEASAGSNTTPVTVYTYVVGTGVTGCGGCVPPPQEFLAVSMPEPGYPALLAIDLLSIVGLFVVCRRRLTGLFN